MNSINNWLTVFIGSATGRVSKALLLSCAILLFASSTKAFSLPEREFLNKNIKFDFGRPSVVRSWVGGQTDKPRPYWTSSRIKLDSFISTQRQPMTSSKPNKEGEKRDKNRIANNSLLNTFKKHGLEWLLCLFAGLVCGGAFGWPPFSRR